MPETLREHFNCPGCGRLDVPFGHEYPPPCGPPVCWWPMMTCLACHGVGEVPGPKDPDSIVRCKKCRGVGYVTDRVVNIGLLAKAVHLYRAERTTSWKR